MSRSPERYTWRGMISRCTNPENGRWHRYGGRGITVCERWLNSFQAFLEDMGKRPEGTTLDRIDNDKGYSPENCRWATRVEQQNNTCKTIWLTGNGETKTLAQWCEITGLHRMTILVRLSYGWTVEKALNTPSKGRGIRVKTGSIYHHLTVTRKNGIRRNCGKNEQLWECKCSCGQVLTVPATRLTGGKKCCGHTVTNRGARNPSAKINNDIAREIFLAQGSYPKIAKRFGLSQPTVALIKQRKRWTEATEGL